MSVPFRSLAAAAVASIALSGCYVVPVAPDAYVAPAVVAAPPMPMVLRARLYPSNEIATRTGVLAGTVTNSLNGKGRFQLDYDGETLVGEATRTQGDVDAGVANAYGERGTYMRCTYRMTTPYQGVGTCDLSNGARYQVHLG
jgi:hypothetical protein